MKEIFGAQEKRGRESDGEPCNHTIPTEPTPTSGSETRLPSSNLVRTDRTGFDASVDEKCEYLEECFRNGPKVCGWSVLNLKHARHAVLATGAAWESFMMRSKVSLPKFVQRFPRLRSGEPVSSWEKSRVYVLAGESGSGKTSAIMLNGKLTLLIQSSDFFHQILRELPRHLPSPSAAPPTGNGAFELLSDGRTLRNDVVAALFAEYVGTLLVQRAPELAKRRGAVTITVGIDEASAEWMGPFLRRLCAASEEAVAQLRALIVRETGGCEELVQGVNVAFVVCGTGVDALFSQPGSVPETYDVVSMPSARQDSLLPEVVRLSQSRREPLPVLGNLTDKFEQMMGLAFGDNAAERDADSEWQRMHVVAMELCVNPRFAAALFGVFNEMRASLQTPQSAVEYMRVALPTAAMVYKSLNSMRDVTAPNVTRAFNRALQLLFQTVREDRDVQRFAQWNAQLHMRRAMGLVTSCFGVVCDAARWMPASGVTSSDVVYIEERDYVLAGPRQRYQMSAFQQHMFRMCYGLKPLHTDWWQSYEKLIADYLRLALWGCEGRTLGELLHHLDPQCDVDIPQTWCSWYSRGLVYEGVDLMYSPTNADFMIESTTSVDTLVDLRRCLDSGRAVIVVNAPSASGADVIALVPQVGFLQVRCKLVQEGSSISLSQAEVSEMAACNSVLAALFPECAAGQPCAIPIIATSIKGDTVAKKNSRCLWWSTNADSSLVPLPATVPTFTSPRDRHRYVASQLQCAKQRDIYFDARVD